MNNNNYVFLLFLLFGIIFFVFYLPMVDSDTFINQSKLKNKFNDLNKIDKNMCSQQCCKFTQWPVPFNTDNPNNDIDYDQFIGSNFSCNNGQSGGGCVCFTPENYKYLANRGYDSSHLNNVPINGLETEI